MAVPRRILQVISPSHMSGAEMQLARLTRRMEARGHRMPVAIKRGSKAAPEFRRLGINAEELPIGGKANPWAIAAMARAAREHGVDLIQSTLSSASWWAGWLESLGGVRSIGHVQGFTSATWHRRQSHLLAVSNAVKDDLIAQGVDGDRITVLYNALGAEEFLPRRDPLSVRSELGADADTPVIGTFGHLSIKKGYRELFAAMPRVLKQFPTAQFWVIGQGRLRKELEEKARRGGYLKNVRFTGYRRDTADLMNAINVMALPSHREPCALVYIEAALSGKPIVACRAGGAVESVADGETGLLVPVRNASAVGEAIGTLLDDRQLAKSLGARGRERARDVFSWERFTETLEGAYDRVLGEPAVRQAA